MTRSRPVFAAMLGLTAFGAAGCAMEIAGADDCLLDHEYTEADRGFRMVLDHDCVSDTVTGTCFDDAGDAFDLEGSVSGALFSFTATRTLPSGDTDTWLSSGLTINGDGATLEGRVTHSGAAGQVLFRR